MQGFYLYTPKKEFFYATDKKNLTTNIIKNFVAEIGKYKNFAPETIQRIQNDTITINQLRYRIEKMQLEKHDNYISIHNDMSSNCYPINDFKNDVIIFS